MSKLINQIKSMKMSSDYKTRILRLLTVHNVMGVKEISEATGIKVATLRALPLKLLEVKDELIIFDRKASTASLIMPDDMEAYTQALTERENKFLNK